MNLKDHLKVNAAIPSGKLIIVNTRLSVKFILQRLAGGWKEKMLLNDYPTLSHKTLKAVFAYAQNYLKDGLFFNKNLVA